MPNPTDRIWQSDPSEEGDEFVSCYGSFTCSGVITQPNTSTYKSVTLFLGYAGLSNRAVTGFGNPVIAGRGPVIAGRRNSRGTGVVHCGKGMSLTAPNGAAMSRAYQAADEL